MDEFLLNCVHDLYTAILAGITSLLQVGTNKKPSMV
jgi:hypothetical protein